MIPHLEVQTRQIINIRLTMRFHHLLSDVLLAKLGICPISSCSLWEWQYFTALHWSTLFICSLKHDHLDITELLISSVGVIQFKMSFYLLKIHVEYLYMK